MFTETIAHIKSTRNAFVVVKQDILNLWGHVKNLNSRLDRIESSLEKISERIDSLEFKDRLDVAPMIESPAKVIIQAPEPKFVANTDSGKLHKEDCVFAKKILPQHKAQVESIAYAASKGYSPCVCMEA